MALPDYTAKGFYDPAYDYPGYLQPQYPRIDITQQSGLFPQMYRQVTTDDPDFMRAEYQRRLTEMGLGGTGSRAKAAQGLYGQFAGGYKQAQLRKNFNLYFPEYLDQTEIDRVINSQSYEQQGLEPNQFGQGKYRWSMRRG